MKLTEKIKNRLVIFVGFSISTFYVGWQATLILVAFGTIMGLAMGWIIKTFTK